MFDVIYPVLYRHTLDLFDADTLNRSRVPEKVATSFTGAVVVWAGNRSVAIRVVSLRTLPLALPGFPRRPTEHLPTAAPSSSVPRPTTSIRLRTAIGGRLGTGNWQAPGLQPNPGSGEAGSRIGPGRNCRPHGSAAAPRFRVYEGFAHIPRWQIGRLHRGVISQSICCILCLVRVLSGSIALIGQRVLFG